MVVDRARAGMGGDDRHARQRQHLVERRVRAVADVDDHAEPVHLGHPLPAERRQAVPARLAGGAVGELVVAAVHRPGQPDAEPVEGGEQRQILAERPAVLDAMKAKCLPCADQALGIVGRSVARPIRPRLSADHPPDRGGADQRRVARPRIAFGGQRALRRVDDEEAAIEPALVHPRQIDLAAVLVVAMALRRNPSRPSSQRSGMSRWVSSTIIRSCAARSAAADVRRLRWPRRGWRAAGRERGRRGGASSAML